MSFTLRRKPEATHTVTQITWLLSTDLQWWHPSHPPFHPYGARDLCTTGLQKYTVRTFRGGGGNENRMQKLRISTRHCKRNSDIRTETWTDLGTVKVNGTGKRVRFLKLVTMRMRLMMMTIMSTCHGNSETIRNWKQQAMIPEFKSRLSVMPYPETASNTLPAKADRLTYAHAYLTNTKRNPHFLHSNVTKQQRRAAARNLTNSLQNC
jgi:hypothetical protein